MKTALITGITGQDGSYLADLLLEKGYRVVGMLRRLSLENYARIEHLADRIELAQGDLLDQASLTTILSEYEPDEVYNLAAMSFVPTSWNQPVLTAEFTALGVTRMLEAIRLLRRPVRFYQASSSEMFGKVRETPQNENTAFYPRSPYGVAKVYGHYMTVNYRESYNLFAVSGILFNHECVTAETPIFVRREGLIDLLPIEDVVPHRTNPSESRYTTPLKASSDFEVWDARGWTRVTCMTANWNGFIKRPNKQVFRIAARGALFHTTGNHEILIRAGESCRERPAEQVQPGDEVALIDLPRSPNIIHITEDEAWFLGVLCAEGYITADGQIHVTNQDESLLQRMAECWQAITGGKTHRGQTQSGFPGGRPSVQLSLRGERAYRRWLYEQIITRTGHKRIPRRILNADDRGRMAFLRGFNAGDGLKSTPCTYEFQGFKTESAVLAAGLYWLAVTTLGQRAIICPWERDGKLYYQINLNSPNVPGNKGQHLRRKLTEVTRADPITYRGWLFDLATESGTFHAGIGQGWIHNSPRRGIEFFPRKVSHGVARIALGLDDHLTLGNLDARRDWGFAGDYVRAMWLMLQQPEPRDYLVATGESHSARELVEIAFRHVGLDPDRYVRFDPRLLRPAEVDHLIGDAGRARAELGWRPEVSFEQLVRMMVDADLALLGRQDGVTPLHDLKRRATARLAGAE